MDRNASQPSVPSPVRMVTERAFTLLTRLRGARPFHPVGRSFAATFTPVPQQIFDVLGSEARPALVRFSNAAGLPPRLPEVFGIAIRIPHGTEAGGPQDFLLTSSADAPVLRHLLRPARGFDRPRFSSLLPYRHRGTLRLIGARHRGPLPPSPLRLADLERVATEDALTFTLDHCTTLGEWRPFAVLHVHARLPATDSQRLRFHPWNTAAQLRPAGFVNRLRAGAYEASQRTGTSE